jgi:16S rRNA U516 pseudouridylate synthase RsuA-like enzyme
MRLDQASPPDPEISRRKAPALIAQKRVFVNTVRGRGVAQVSDADRITIAERLPEIRCCARPRTGSR